MLSQRRPGKNAIEEANSKISKKLSFSHLSAIIVSDYSAKEGIYDTVDYFEGMPDVRPQVLIAVSDIKPSLYLENLKPSLEVNTEKYFLSLFQKDSSYIPVLKMSDYTNSVKCSKDVIAPLITKTFGDDKSDGESTFLLGAVVLRNGKMCFECDDMVTLGLLNSTKNVVLDYQNQKYIINAEKAPTLTAKLNGEKPVVNIHLDVSNKNGIFTDGKYIEERIESYLKKVSEFGYDIFGFSDLLKKSFRTIQSYEKYNWQKSIVNCDYNVEVKISDGK